MLLKVEPVPLQLNVANGLYLKIASNLADLNNAVVARASLGLGSLATVNDAPSDGTIYGRQNGAWAAVSVLPVVDETAIVFETGVPANTLTFDVSAYTAAHVVTWPDAAMTVAGLEVANVFTAAQTINATATGSSACLYVQQLAVWGGANYAVSVVGYTNLNGFRITGADSTNSIYGASGGGMGFTINSGQKMMWSFWTGSANNIIMTMQSNAISIGGDFVPASLVHLKMGDSVTNAITNIQILGHNSTGTPAAGFGAGLKFTLESSTTADQDAARLATLWNVATHASRAADLVAYASDYNAEREIWRGRADGTNPLFGVLGATPVVRQSHIADPAGGLTVDAEARTAINAILVVLENFGFVATS